MTTKNADIISEITRLKKQRNAVILAHNYQRSEVQDIADFTGDSLELSQKAAKTTAEVIVFCGVHFMAETAYIINPRRVVLMPEIEAGCPMADMITADALIAKKKELRNPTVVCYVNSTAAVKAESDICCTSGNAVQVVNSIGDKEILFVPDQYLGQWVAEKTGKKMHLWPGFCPTHMRILPEDILRLKNKHPGYIGAWCIRNAVPDAKAVCRCGIEHGSDDANFVRESNAPGFIIGTETGIIYRLQERESL
jgi:quinolinate synthase